MPFSVLGIRHNGLTILTCKIFWTVLAPIALFGCELLLWDQNIAILEDFQNYAGKIIQRFYSMVPNVCAFHALGWICLERLV